MVSVINQRLRADVTLTQALVTGNVMDVQLFSREQCVTDLLIDVLVYRAARGTEDANALCQFAKVNAALFCEPRDLFMDAVQFAASLSGVQVIKYVKNDG